MNENGRLYSFLVTWAVFYVRSVDIGCFKWYFYCPILGHCLTVKKKLFRRARNRRTEARNQRRCLLSAAQISVSQSTFSACQILQCNLLVFFLKRSISVTDCVLKFVLQQVRHVPTPHLQIVWIFSCLAFYVLAPIAGGPGYFVQCFHASEQLPNVSEQLDFAP